MPTPDDDLPLRLLDAALPHVAFDGWSETTFAAAIRDSGADPVLARALCPRGAPDLAVLAHRRGDAEMARRLAADDLDGMRYRDRIAAAIRHRIEAAGDKETVRRSATLFALPQYGAEGARLIWGSCDLIWRALGDTSDDINWYTKRATLAGVYGATLLYWLGDTSPGDAATWEFLDRRIEDVMRIEKAKARMRKTPLLRSLLAGPARVLDRVRAPARPDDSLWPGHRPGPDGPADHHQQDKETT